METDAGANTTKAGCLKMQDTAKRLKGQPITCIQCHKSQTAAAAALCVTDEASVQPRQQPRTALADVDLQP